MEKKNNFCECYQYKTTVHCSKINDNNILFIYFGFNIGCSRVYYSSKISGFFFCFSSCIDL